MKTLFTFLLFSSFLFAKLSFTKEEIEFIKNYPTIKVALTNDKPFTFKQEGKIKGLTIDILDEISKQTNLKFSIRQNPWVDNFKDFKSGRVDIISDLFYKKNREKFTLYSEAYIDLPLVIFAHETYPNFDSFKDLGSIKVGVIKDSSVTKSLQKYPNIQVVEFEKQEDQISALSFKKVDFVLQTLYTANVYIRKNFLTNLYPIKTYDDGKYYEALHFGISKQKPILQSIINKVLNNIDLKQLEEKWFDLKVKTPKISLTKKEKEFLQSHPIITLGTERSWEPYVIKQEDGDIIGYDADILNKINKLTGSNFQLRLGNWKEMQELAKRKKVDGLSTGAIHDERKKYLNFSDLYMSLQKMVIVKHRNPLGIKSKKDLEGKTIVIHKGNLVDEKIAKEFPKSNIIKADSIDDMLKEVIYGQADATFGNGATEYIANKLGLPYLDFAFALDHRLELAFGVRKDWPEAISIINKALNNISEYEKLRLKEKWFILSEYEKKLKPIKKKVILSVDEKLYIKENPDIKICIDPDWYPFEYLNNQKEHDGLIAELFNKVTSNLELKAKLVITKDWQESMNFMENKKCDLLASAQKTKNREKFLNFTSSYVSSPIVVATKSTVSFVDDFSKVKDKTYAVVKGYAILELLKQKYPNIKIIEVDNIASGLKLILQNKAFGFIDTVPTIISAIKENGYFDLSINGKVDLNLELRIATRYDTPILNTIFEKGVQSLTNKEKDTIYDKWINVSNIKDADYTIFWQALSGMIFIILIILFWNRQLKKKIDEAVQKYKEQEGLLFYYSKQKSMGELIGNISHQWRHPLSELSGNIMNLETKQKLGKSIDHNELEMYIQSSKKIINFMSDTIETFYNFYKDNRENRKFNISEAIEETLLILNGTFKLDNISVVKKIDNDIYLNGNPNELKQVLLAIFVNAKLVFKLRDIQNPKIEVSVGKIEKNRCVIIIADNGGGIENNLINKIFDLHFSNAESSGIGLYISKKIIEEKFNGELEVLNDEEGAVFKLNLAYWSQEYKL